MKMTKTLIVTLLIATTLASVGCKKDGPLEKAGSRVDEVADNVKDGDPILKKKGPLEKTGEAIDDAVSPNK